MASQKLRESEEKFKLLFENSPLGVVHFDQGGAITTCNDNFAAITQETKDVLLGKDIVSIFPSEQLQHAFTKTLSGGTTHYEKTDILLNTKEVIPVRAMVGPVYSAEGKVTGGICMFEDITAGVEAEKETAMLEKKLQQAMKMEAIGTLAGGIAHDFNNILSAILGNAEIAKLKLGKKDTYEDELDGIFKAGLRAKELVQHILAFSRKNDTKREVLQPSMIVAECARMLRPIFPATIAIQTNINKDVPHIMANPAQLHQVVMNLSTNALHAMEPNGGQLEIALQEALLSPEDLVNEPTVLPGKYIRLRVSDSGVGMPENIQDRIFDPYYTTKGTGKGTGLGLSIVHGIVNSYKGFISVHSQSGRGTAVDVFFPVYSGSIGAPEKEIDAVLLGNEHILLVDDEGSIVEVNRKILEELGYSVTGVTCSQQAFEIFTDNPEKFDLVITDYTMPIMTGASLAAKLLELRPDLPIILCTGYSANISEEKADQLGVKAFVYKPLVKNEIAVHVRRALSV